MLSDHTTPATPSVNVTPDLASRATGLLSRFYGWETPAPEQPPFVMPGDRVKLSLERLALSGQYEVIRSRSRMDGSGERTELTLSVR